jgi:hypothetical protein
MTAERPIPSIDMRIVCTVDRPHPDFFQLPFMLFGLARVVGTVLTEPPEPSKWEPKSSELEPRCHSTPRLLSSTKMCFCAAAVAPSQLRLRPGPGMPAPSARLQRLGPGGSHRWLYYTCTVDCCCCCRHHHNGGNRA